MPDVFHSFRRGRRLMVQIRSSGFSLADFNPQRFVRTPEAVPSDFQKAIHRVWRSPEAPSRVAVGVLPEPAAARRNR